MLAHQPPHVPENLPAAVIAAACGEASPSHQPISAVQVVINFPPVVGYAGLSQLLGRSEKTLQADRCRNPASVPPAATPPGSRTPLWIVAEVIAWLQQHKEKKNGGGGVCVQRRKPGPGASTKAERLAAKAAGLSVKEWRAQQGGAQ